MNDPIISFRDFTFQYRAQARPTLHNINLDIYPGEKILVAGIDIEIDVVQRGPGLRAAANRRWPAASTG